MSLEQTVLKIADDVSALRRKYKGRIDIRECYKIAIDGKGYDATEELKHLVLSELAKRSAIVRKSKKKSLVAAPSNIPSKKNELPRPYEDCYWNK